MNRRPRTILRLLCLLTLPLLSGAARQTAVSMKDLAFSPASVSIKVGDTVTWTNLDDRDHALKSTDGTLDSGNLPPGKSFSHTFRQAGNFGYASPYYPRMKGSITVD